MKKLLKHIKILIPSMLLALIILVIPQLNNSELMDPTQSGKAFSFLWGMLGYLVIVLFIAATKRDNITVRITIVDLLLGAYSLMVAISYLQHPVDQLQMLTFGALTLFYLSVRFLNQKYLYLLLFAVVISGTVQAIYGNMQLYGFSPSNHGLFRITGSFFNPGPYAGYLAAVFPVSLGFYLFYDSVSIPIQHPFILKLTSCAIKIKPFIKRISFIDHFFYSANKEEYPAEMQAERIRCSLNTIIKSLLLISIIAMCLVLPASRSRAAWLAVLISCGYLLSVRYQLLSQIRSIFHTRIKRFILLSSLIIAITVIGAGLYYFKQGSADGRLLIWKVSGSMFTEKPIWGHGAHKFAADYMNYQAAYFKANPDVSEAIYADNVTYAYNELLKIAVEKGIIGLLLALALIGCLYFVKTDSEKSSNSLSLLAARGSLLSIIVFAQFSYPSEILPIKMLFVSFATVVSTYQNPIYSFHMQTKKTTLVSTQNAGLLRKVFEYVVFVFALILVCPANKYLTQQYQAYKTWKDASDIYNVGAYPECLEDFELAYALLKTNGSFLVQYGKALEIAGKYHSSIVILNEAKQHLNNTILYTSLGNNYKALNKDTEAEQAYLHVWNMAPARFYPLYLLAKLYNETGKKGKAVAMANKVMEKEVKIESTAIEEIKAEMRKIIEKHKVKALYNNDIKTYNTSDKAPLVNNKDGAYSSLVFTTKFILQKW